MGEIYLILHHFFEIIFETGKNGTFRAILSCFFRDMSKRKDGFIPGGT